MIYKTEHNRAEQCSIPCNLCGATVVETLSLKDRNDNYLRTVICRKCGLIWSDPRPADEKVREFYSKEYRKEYKGITKPRKKHVYRDAKEAMKRYNYFKEIISKEGSLLDIGASSGVFVYSMRKLGYNARGIEPDENHARYAREELQIPVKTGFAKKITDETKETFDGVTLHHVLEHITNPLAELQNISGILKENGYLVVEVPNAEDIKQDPKNRYHKAHIYTFNPETLVALGKRAGFQVVKKTVAPLNGNISIIFRKKQVASNVSQFDELDNNSLKVMNLLNRHTNLRHFTSFVPYKKIVVNALTAIREKITIRKFNTEKDIIDAVVLKENH